MRKALLAIALVIPVLVLPESALACSCAWIEDPDERYATWYGDADVIFQGTVIERTEVEMEVRYLIETEKVWKGRTDAYSTVITARDSATCGIDLKEDERYVIFADASDGKLHTGLCSGTSPSEDAPEITAWLNDRDFPASCEPIVCENGSRHPTCTEDGHPIQYFAYPCDVPSEEEGTPPVFRDVPDGHPNVVAITFVKEEGIVSGYDDGTYKPDAFINRAEFTKILIGAMLIQDAREHEKHPDWPQREAPGTCVPFPDVPGNAWFAEFVCRARGWDIISGYPDGTFKPEQTINFAEASKIVANAFGLWNDYQGKSWWEPYVVALSEINALPPSFTDPGQLVTRAEMAEMIYRVMKALQ